MSSSVSPTQEDLANVFCVHVTRVCQCRVFRSYDHERSHYFRPRPSRFLALHCACSGAVVRTHCETLYCEFLHTPMAKFHDSFAFTQNKKRTCSRRSRRGQWLVLGVSVCCHHTAKISRILGNQRVLKAHTRINSDNTQNTFNCQRPCAPRENRVTLHFAAVPLLVNVS